MKQKNTYLKNNKRIKIHSVWKKKNELNLQILGCAHVVMVIAMENGHSNLSSNPGHSTYTLGNGMHPTILSVAMGK